MIRISKSLFQRCARNLTLWRRDQTEHADIIESARIFTPHAFSQFASRVAATEKAKSFHRLPALGCVLFGQLWLRRRVSVQDCYCAAENFFLPLRICGHNLKLDLIGTYGGGRGPRHT